MAGIESKLPIQGVECCNTGPGAPCFADTMPDDRGFFPWITASQQDNVTVFKFRYALLERDRSVTYGVVGEVLLPQPVVDVVATQASSQALRQEIFLDRC